MRYIVVHDDGLPGPMTDMQISIEGMSREEILNEVADTLDYIERAKQNPEEHLEHIYGSAE